MTELSSLDPRIDQVNARLKAARLGLRIERRGQTLNLRGTLPPRPGSHRLRSYQQRIPLGIPATKAGLKQIEQEAKVIAARLIEHRFDWHDYLQPGGPALSSRDLDQQIEAFRQHFLARRCSDTTTTSAHTTWEKAYAPYLRQLLVRCQRTPSLNLPEAIYATVQATAADSRSRQVCCTALAAFAEFYRIDLPIELKQYWGRYGSGRTQKRDLPADADIVTWFERIPNPAWRFVYGIMASYGLRNHEVFFCDYSALGQGDPEAVIAVDETTKTGFHEVWPFPPQWVDQFGLRSVQLPQIQTDLSRTSLQRIGQQVTTQFRRYGIPFSPYDLRHAWAVRTILMGLPDTVAARMMGHSVAIHNRTYQRWITRRDQQQAVRNALGRG
ncbi:Excisase A [Halomicronema hongdechloris C2206]|uniref:Excisase A n=1 Tax=Halomicronema hongdechloris C2206 TaxID=1641165 RepID=A0A1Z3HNU0_9CYAN|nr:site-specific integrase [Halomicronema hongdechloris]ASC71974.1 Excisase A [Halomicronema hongdechloris C2206]